MSGWRRGLKWAVGTVLLYGNGVLPNALLSMRVSDIQVDRSGRSRRILVAFQGSNTAAGTVGIYTGP